MKFFNRFSRRGLLLLVLYTSLSVVAHAQKYSVAEGVITFFSSATLEDIKADNRKVASVFNTASGEIAFSIPINQFQFEKKLMQEHFNEKYLESDKYPKSTFAGKVEGFTMGKPGMQQATAKGKLTIHGVTRDVEIPGTIEVQAGSLKLQSKFMVKLEDYNVKIPKLMWQNIAEQVEVTVDLTYKPQ
ncbi:MAG: YceI family protein [Flammeovirgaceae bacterium]|nr:MAG: YceI family protein [Flammeovirgaceae bacterium]